MKDSGKTDFTLACHVLATRLEEIMHNFVHEFCCSVVDFVISSHNFSLDDYIVKEYN